MTTLLTTNATDFTATLLMRVLTFILFFQLTPCCWAAFWSRDLKKATNPSQLALSVNGATDAVLTAEEIDALQLNREALDGYARRPDCFRTAAGLIRSHCAQLDMHENERVNAAISMTLCELATAKHHSIPLECVPFSLNSDFLQTSPRQGECVDALSRSAQFWSSYSGYLREVPQLCFAFRRWHDIDTARDIYRNATLDQATFLRHLMARGKAAELNHRSWENRLTELQKAVSYIHLATSSIDSSLSHFNIRLIASFDEALHMFRDAVSDHQTQEEQRELGLVLKTSRALENLYQHHAEELRAMVPSLETSLIKHTDIILANFNAETQTSLDITNQIQERWVSFESGIESLTQSIILLSATASEVAHNFEGSIRQAQILNQTQFEASLSATHLMATLSNLTTTTHAELAKINNASDALIQRTFLYAESSKSSWIIWSFMRVFGTILRVDATSLEYISHLTTFRIFLFALKLASAFLRSIFSGLMTMCILVLSLRRYLAPSLAISDLPPSTPMQPSFYQYHPSATFTRESRLPRRLLYGPRVSRIPERLCRPMQ
ncbi:hypothetical protein D9615_006138 [Tricholomella constricta]|uniref:Karyogamy protein 5 n=1 Tax=Tricholomella constricta TaxID=117010 RepID=A0A8H5HB99_9AGAR|nr:hypothetical protein D9615_006138 [Tricholomella constricta]